MTAHRWKNDPGQHRHQLVPETVLSRTWPGKNLSSTNTPFKDLHHDVVSICIYVIKLDQQSLQWDRQEGQEKSGAHLIHPFFDDGIRWPHTSAQNLLQLCTRCGELAGNPWGPQRNLGVMVDILDLSARWHAQSNTKTIICEPKCIWKAHQERGSRRLQGQSLDRERYFRAVHAELDLASTLQGAKRKGKWIGFEHPKWLWKIDKNRWTTVL